jgi:DNA-directed RNA polymerase subunit RPC12/RpoP
MDFMKECPNCGKTLYLNMGITAPYYHCTCGYDSRNETYYYSNGTFEYKKMKHQCPECGREFND